ncbi:M23 family metallopeptidase [Candidatus Uhrbacteria bacterium]|nr:M23 family metallopeptidase [Candidatus Uhrbacteria bacterium]
MGKTAERGAVSAVVVLVLCSTFYIGCEEDLSNHETDRGTFAIVENSIPIGFDRLAYQISFDDRGSAIVNEIETKMPVLSFSGTNSDRTLIAYTPLALNYGGGNASITLEDSLGKNIDELSPSGLLVIENVRGELVTVYQPGCVIINAVWSPVDPEVIVFGFTGLGGSGLTLYNVREKASEIIFSVDGLVPDNFIWSDDGLGVEACVLDAADMGDGTCSFRHVPISPSGLSLPATFFLSSNFFLTEGKKEFSVRLKNGTFIRFPKGLLGGVVGMYGKSAEHSGISHFRADQIRHMSRNGVGFVNFDSDKMRLFVSNGITTPVEVSSRSAVSYKMPMHAYEDTSITQVGAAYGGGCQVSSHSLGGSMQYAVDFQVYRSGYDEIVASASGTISSGSSSVSCNAIDTVGCSIYANPCSCNGGWGNYVMIYHSDGRYTFYAHLENTNYRVTGCNPVAQGCWLADEGATGNSSGSKNGCGDHLHFQWQNSGVRGAASVSGSFSDLPVGLGAGSCGYHDTSSTVSSCSL